MSRATAFADALRKDKDAPEKWKVTVAVAAPDDGGTVWYALTTRYEGTRTATATRRFSEFRALRQDAAKVLKLSAKFPARSVLSGALSASALEKRASRLRDWVSELASKRDRLDEARARALRMFLGLEAGWERRDDDAASAAPSTPSRSVASTPNRTPARDNTTSTPTLEAHKQLSR